MVSSARPPAPENELTQGEPLPAEELDSLSLAVGGLAHDVNNFLTGVLGNTELLLRKLSDDPECRSLAQEIERSALQAGELTRKILDYAGRGELVAKPVDLTALLQGMARLLETSTPKTAQLLWRLDESLPTLYGEAEGLRQLVVHLVQNAADALGGSRGYVSLSTGVQHLEAQELATLCAGHVLVPGRCVFLEVSDTGCGMDASLQRRIFDPFFSTKPAARGLGLTWALGVVRKHSGGIRLESAPGSGTTFRIYLPMAQPAATMAEPSSAGQFEKREDLEDRAAGCILVVDDEHFVRTVTQGILEDAGYDTLGAQDGQRALEIFEDRQGAVDLVVLDLTMPGMSGYETLRELRRLSPRVNVLLTSGYSEAPSADRASGDPQDGEPAAQFLRKPYRPQQLVEAVQRILS